MRLLPILTATIVVALLYTLIFQRDILLPAAATPPEPEEAAAEVSEVVSVVARHSTAQQIDSRVLLRGQTEAARQVDLRSETSGLIISEPLPKGTSVETGQRLCEIDPGTRIIGLAEAEARLQEARARLPEAEAGIPAAEARLAEAKARAVEARARLEEAEINERAAVRLKEGGFASETGLASAEAALEAARAGVSAAESGVKAAASGMAGARSAIETVKAGIRSAEAAVASAQKEIERLTIRAPFDGLLESDTAEIGSLMQPGALCATVIRLDPIRLVGFVPETEVDRINVGAMAGGRLASGREVLGRVTFLSRSADPQTRTFRTEITVPNADLAIRDGQTAEMLIEGEGTVAHLLPQSALTLNDEGELGVRIVGADSRAEFVPVALVRDARDGVWLTGLPETVDVIVVGQEFVTDGVPIEAEFTEASR